MNNTANAGFIWLFGAPNIPSGSQTINAVLTDTGQQFAFGYLLSATYTGVGSVGALQTAHGSSTSPSVAVSSALNHAVFGIIANYQNPAYSSFSLTQRKYQSVNDPTFIAGDTAGASSVTVSAAQSSALPWAAVGIDLA
jgi:hypothetical protein